MGSSTTPYRAHTLPDSLKIRCGFRLHRRLSVNLIEFVPTLPPSGICVNSAKTPKSNVKTRYFSVLCTNVREQRTIGAKNITGITVFLGILIIEAITFSYYRQKYNFSAAPCLNKIQHNGKSWNNTLFLASFQHKKEIPDLKLYQVWYLFWQNYDKLIQCTAL